MTNTKDLLLSLQQYQACPAQAPKALIQNIVWSVYPEYKVYGLHAVGGEAYVIKAQTLLGRDVALKFIFPSFDSIEGKRHVISWNKIGSLLSKKDYEVKTVNDVTRRFIEGAKLQNQVYQTIIQERVDYFTVPAVYNTSENPLHMEMEWKNGVPILDWIANEHLRLDQILKIYKNLVIAVKFLHDRGVLHRDLKPGNILIEQNPKTGAKDSVCILDWSTAKNVVGDRNITIQSVGIGTRPYATPKQMANFRDVTVLDEIYSLGFILAAMILNKDNDIISANPKESYQDIALRFRSQIARHPNFPSIIKHLFKAATEPLEQNRLQTVDAIISEVDDIFHQMETTSEGREILQVQPMPYNMPTPSMIMDMHVKEKPNDAPKEIKRISVLKPLLPPENQPRLENQQRLESEIPTVITTPQENPIPKKYKKTIDNFTIEVFAANYAKTKTRECAKKNRGNKLCIVDCTDCQKFTEERVKENGEILKFFLEFLSEGNE